jgi:acyl-coenzyme A synthetase/AMP-(fatty) acid ligase/acyl carrier protein
VLHCVPSVFRSLLSRELHPALFGSLTHVVMAGEPLHPADVDRWMAVFGTRVQLVNLYGPTETTMTKLFHRVAEDDRARRTVPIGRAMPGAQVAVMDADGAACPPGAVGEIWIRTPYRAHGYWNRPELTAEVFVPNPRTGDPADVLYRTGDLGRMLPDGALEFIGRRDHQVKIRGVRVEPAEVEGALRAHPAVADAAVRDWDDAEGGKSLAAYVVAAGELTAGELRAHLLGLLPEALVPSAFVMMGALPRTPNGKTDRAALPEPAKAAAADATRERVAPADETEAVVAALWCEVLGVDEVGVTDDFFEVGGHSLRMARVAAAVEETFAVEVPLRAFFESPTVRGQAAVLVAGESRPRRTLDVARMFMQVAAMSADEIALSLRDDAPAAAN